ncbi:zinc finger RNA-binding protein isoform X2 [Neodiprion pinetum]|uniref:zinc finger RNA-binding protein isoform X2 n=1 Tax=Neodiprion pinetum TaxID=441929 RepID=UPI001EDE8487|nr:zinc finger RNA-binding protein isoform X2 [Neodiprion pinetum]XP_046611916.1 zinc finger RNA-binding protein isoform X2 [Neodiprion virginianus]
MAQNNYFGFTHGGTQYGATSAAAYQTGQAGYAVTPAATAATYTQRPAAAAATGYETYQAAAAAAATGTTYAANAGTVAQTYDYGYGRAAPAPTYDATKTYYQQPAAAPATYTTTETHYQAAKPAYSTTSAYTGTARQATTTGQAKTYQASSTAYQQPNPAQNPTYSTGYTAPATPAATASTPTNKTASTTYSGYDAALYSAATMYVAQQSANSNTNNQKSGGWQGYGRKGFGAGGGAMKSMRPKQTPKPQQLHYCDVCKISCAGPQTYREHLEGQKHKKKEASLKVPQQPPARGAGNSLRCELCDVTCTGNDAYAAHIRGAKHQKVVKLHTKLGKPIPSADPTVLNPKPAAVVKATVTKKATVTATPKINFVASGNLGTVAQPPVTGEVKVEEPVADDTSEDATIDEKDIQPVGQEYIEENKSEDGKIISFNCKLCECRFNDPNAKDMHMKGRRHRFAYKKKVNPDLVVDMKPSLKQRKMLEEKLRRQQMRDEYMRRREEINQLGPIGPMGPMMDEEMLYWEERRRYEDECEYYEWYRRYGRGPGAPPLPRPFPGPPPMMMFPGPQRRPESSDDKHVLSHHSTIYPKEEELQAVQKIVSHTEKALKFVSDTLAEGGKKPAPAVAVPAPVATTPATATTPVAKDDAAVKKDGEADKKQPQAPQKEDGSDGNLFSFQKEKEDSRILRGVMRVGNLAKGLLLSGDNHVCLVVLCAEKPTKTLLNKVAEILPTQLKTVAPDDTYNVGKHPESAALTVSGGSVTVSVTLTSPLMRETPKVVAPAENAGQQQQGAAQPQATPATPAATKPDPPDVLPKAKCLEALAALRHAKWFQARATSLQSCVMVIRIMRDLCNRVPTWGPLNAWALELLAEKVISTAGGPLSPGEALRRLLECVAGGILLPGSPVISPGLLDPCEKEPVDAIGNMTAQQREDITSSAQHALRLVAFRQIHKVLGIEQLPPPKYKGRFARKRRRDNSNCEGTDSEASKKDKKAEEIKMETDAK